MSLIKEGLEHNLRLEVKEGLSFEFCRQLSNHPKKSVGNFQSLVKIVSVTFQPLVSATFQPSMSAKLSVPPMVLSHVLKIDAMLFT